jgi:uncharacterized membrane protein YjfL (UPF0719 family)
MHRVQPDTLTRVAFALGTALGLLLLFHLVQRLFSPRHTLWSDARAGNLAYLLVQSGHVLAVLLLGPGIVREASTHGSLVAAAGWAAAFAVAGILLIQIVGTVGIRLLLRGELAAELESGNLAAGVAAAANYVAVGLLAAPAIAGSDLPGLGLSVVFFTLAVVTQAAYVALFRTLTTYDDAEQIAGENMAAALSYAGISIAIAIVLARALTGGDFVGWGPALTGYAWVAAAALFLYPVRQLIGQALILGSAPTVRGGRLDESIGTRRNVSMAVMEGLTYLATALAVVQLL